MKPPATPGPITVGPFRVTLLQECGPVRRQCERDIVQAGGALPLPHRVVWAEHLLPHQWFVAVHETEGHCVAGFGVEVSSSRAIPGHLVLRVDRLGTGLDPSAVAAGMTALGEWTRDHRRILRTTVQCFSPIASMRSALEEALAGSGFARDVTPRNYTTTLWWELTGTDEERLAALSRRTRRDVRTGLRPPVRLQTLDDPRWIPRLNQLYHETMRRSGGPQDTPPWSAILALSRIAPEASRVVGLVREDVVGIESLLSYAWGCCHGPYAHYDLGASTRLTDLKHPLGYALVWDLSCWASSVGATAFDLGGVTTPETGGAKALQGISDFKRHFCDTVLSVASEWRLEPHPGRARLARAIGAAARRVRHRFAP